MNEYLLSWPPEVLDVLGVLGFALYVLNYMMLTLRRIDSEHILYFVLNVLAAGLVLISLMQAFNLASVLIQVFWVIISVIGITIRVGRHRTERVALPAAE